jgi:hypothetical protein
MIQLYTPSSHYSNYLFVSVRTLAFSGSDFQDINPRKQEFYDYRKHIFYLLAPVSLHADYTSINTLHWIVPQHESTSLNNWFRSSAVLEEPWPSHIFSSVHCFWLPSLYTHFNYVALRLLQLIYISLSFSIEIV